MSEIMHKAGAIIMLLFSILLSLICLISPEDRQIFSGTGRNQLYSEVPFISHISPHDPINCGDISELCVFPGIGEATASLVIEERNLNGPFIYPEDILSVKGIGEKKLDKIRPFLQLIDP